MAVTTTYINGDITKLKAVLESLDFFSSVTYDNENSPTSVTVKDADSNTLAVFSTYGVTAYASASVSRETSWAGYVMAYAYSCPNGVIIKYTHYQGYYAYIMVTKTSTGAVAFVASTSNTSYITAMRTFTCVAWGDNDQLNTVSNVSNFSNQQTILVPFPTNSASNHTVDAFFTMFGPYSSMDYLEFTIGSQRYFTTGCWVMRDMRDSSEEA